MLLYSVFGKENQSNIFRIWYGCNVLLITLVISIRVIWNNVLIISICSNERNSDISSKLIWMRKWKFYVWRASNSRPSVSMLSAIFSWAINIKNKCICVIIIQIRKSGKSTHSYNANGGQIPSRDCFFWNQHFYDPENPFRFFFNKNF